MTLAVSAFVDRLMVIRHSEMATGGWGGGRSRLLRSELRTAKPTPLRNRNLLARAAAYSRRKTTDEGNPWRPYPYANRL